jgi:hypothetical protein
MRFENPDAWNEKIKQEQKVVMQELQEFRMKQKIAKQLDNKHVATAFELRRKTLEPTSKHEKEFFRCKQDLKSILNRTVQTNQTMDLPKVK